MCTVKQRFILARNKKLLSRRTAQVLDLHYMSLTNDQYCHSETSLSTVTHYWYSETCLIIQVIRDPTTQASQGYAFIELSSVAESVSVLETLKGMNPQLEVDGKQVLVSFAKNTFTTSWALYLLGMLALYNVFKDGPRLMHGMFYLIKNYKTIDHELYTIISKKVKIYCSKCY